MSLKPLSAQMHFVDGVVQPDAQVPGLYAQKTANYAVRGRERDAIFLHLSISGPLEHNEAFLDQLKAAFVHTFQTTQGGATSALRSAVYATNAFLVESNRATQVNRAGALCAAVLRDSELYMAQVGESYAFIGRSFGLEPFPKAKPDVMTPLGQQSGLDIRFFHNRLQSGDLLLMLDPRVAHVSTQKYVTALVGQTVNAAMAALSEQLNTNTGRLLLVEFSETATRSVYFSAEQIRGAPEPPTVANPIDLAPPVRKRDDEARSEALYERRKMLEEQARLLAAQEKAAEDAQADEADEEFDEMAEALFSGILPNPAPLAPEPEIEPEIERPDPVSFAELAANAAPDRPDASLYAEPIEPPIFDDLDDLEAPPLPRRSDIPLAAPIDAEPVREPATVRADAPAGTAKLGNPIERQSRKAASGVLGAASRFLRWLATLLTRFRAPNQQDLNAPRGERMWATILSIVIPLIVTLVVSGVYLQSRERNEVATIRRNLQVTLNEAITLENESGDLDAARIRYFDVIALADAADDRIEDNADIVLSKQIAREAIDRLDGVQRVQARTLYRYDEDVKLDAIELGVDSSLQTHVFVLDKEQDFVDNHKADPSLLTFSAEPVRLLARGQAVQLHIIGNLLDIEWKGITANTDEALVAVDQSGAAISYYPAAAVTVSSPLGLAREWANPGAVASYIGRIYVLDSGSETSSGQVWRYLPDGRNFNMNEESRSLMLPDMASAIDILIDPEDASVIVLHDDGRIRRYRNDRLIWDESTLALNGLTEQLVAPVAVKLSGTGPRSSYYILDPASNRIVEISRAGALLSQFRMDLDDGSTDILLNTTDFYVTQAPRKFFLVVDNVIAVAER